MATGGAWVIIGYVGKAIGVTSGTLVHTDKEDNEYFMIHPSTGSG